MRERFGLRSQLMFLAIGMVLAALAPLGGSAHGNADAAHACQHGGYLTYTTQDGEPFSSVGECVSYVANGGTLVSSESALAITASVSTPDAEGHFSLTVSGTGYTPGDYVYLTIQKYAGATYLGVATPVTSANDDGEFGPDVIDLDFLSCSSNLVEDGQPVIPDHLAIKALDHGTLASVTTTVGVDC